VSLSHGSELSERVIGLAIDVHRQLRPGRLEPPYEECLRFESKQAGIEHRRQVPCRRSTRTSGLNQRHPQGWPAAFRAVTIDDLRVLRGSVVNALPGKPGFIAAIH
jgi:PD-(D/E)XK nuclease superfamily